MFIFVLLLIFFSAFCFFKLFSLSIFPFMLQLYFLSLIFPSAFCVLKIFLVCVLLPVFVPVFMSCLRCSFSRPPRMSPTCRRRTKRLANCSSLRQPPSCPSSCQCLIRFLHGVRPLYYFYFPSSSASWDLLTVVVVVDFRCSCRVVTAP